MPSLMRSLPESCSTLGGSLQHGYQTLVAADGELAIEIYRREPPRRGWHPEIHLGEHHNRNCFGFFGQITQ
jgi:hypothetical protein